jgi:hypothetical protein
MPAVYSETDSRLGRDLIELFWRRDKLNAVGRPVTHPRRNKFFGEIFKYSDLARLARADG